MIATSALITAAGRGKRFGSDRNKVFAEVLGKPIIAHALTAFQNCEAIDEIVLVVGEADLVTAGEMVRACGPFDKLTQVVPGGEERGDSVRTGLAHVQGEIVAIHDGARPLVTPEIILRSVKTAKEWGAAVAAVPVVDTIKQADEAGVVQSTLDRSRLFNIQTPQTFCTESIRRAYDWAEREGVSATDDSALYEKAIGTVKLVEGSYDNIKVTTPRDLVIVECRMQNTAVISDQLSVISARSQESDRPGHAVQVGRFPDMLSADAAPDQDKMCRERGAGTAYPGPSTNSAFRAGFGYDVHKLVPGRRLVLGGVEFDSEVGLLGHSDADVILHAISDALLGAAALGDIGKLFPNTDPAYKDADSLTLLANVVRVLSDEGWAVVNVDAMMIGEHPKISPYVEDMRRKIAGAVGTDFSSVSIKATTAEGLGYIGAGEGICCYAVATIAGK